LLITYITGRLCLYARKSAHQVDAEQCEMVSSLFNENVVELTFHYKTTGAGGQVNEFTGKHIQTRQNRKIIKEEYISIS
jgi:hypothetical protein